MKTIKGPAIFLAQFASDQPPFNKLEDIARWAANLGYEGVQAPLLAASAPSGGSRLPAAGTSSAAVGKKP